MYFTYLLQFISLDFWSIIWTIFTWFATLFTCYLLLYLPVCHFIYLFATLFTWFHFSISFSFSTWIYHGFESFVVQIAAKAINAAQSSGQTGLISWLSREINWIRQVETTYSHLSNQLYWPRMTYKPRAEPSVCTLSS